MNTETTTEQAAITNELIFALQDLIERGSVEDWRRVSAHFDTVRLGSSEPEHVFKYRAASIAALEIANTRMWTK